MSCHLHWSSCKEPPATNFCYERKTVPFFYANPKPLESFRWATAFCPSHGRLSGPPPHPGEEGLWGGRVPIGTGAGVPVPFLPQLSATGPAAGRGQARLSAQSERAGGRTLTRAGVGAGRGGARQGTLTQQQYILPRGELGARAGGDLAKDAGPSGEQRRTLRPGTGARGRDGPGLGALGRGLLRTQWPRHGIPRCPQGRECQWGPREGWGRYQRFCPSSSSPAAAPPLPDVSSLAKGPPV